jgi:cell wall-associated NlpC family hydrolase
MKTQVQRLTNPDRIRISDSKNNWLATMTAGAYTVTLAGPQRTFLEPTAGHAVKHKVWVRTLPGPFNGKLDARWLRLAFEENEQKVPDVLAIAMQYIKGAPEIFEGGLPIAGDAAYGPLKDGKREEGADFNDYLGIAWKYPEKLDKPEPSQRSCLDCSGFVRMVWGYRHNLPGGRYADLVPLCLTPRRDHSAIPRRAFQIYEAAPGVVIEPDSGDQIKDFSQLGVGDLVFFDADDNDGTRIDHIGMYLGPDAGGHHRFISSRKGANGPTLGDYKGKSILDGIGLYAKSFRAARRL